MSAHSLAEMLALDPIPLTVRRRRAANGSRRKRDLAAVQMADELARLESVGQADAEIARYWTQAKERLRSTMSESVFDLWMAPVELAGTADSSLILSAPEQIKNWTKRRFSRLIREALASVDCPYSDIEFVGEGEPCL